MLGPVTPAASARGEDGFTLIEALVATVTGMVVVLALFAILEVSVTQSTKLADRSQATQAARTTMNHIVDELHSACISQGFAPVLEESTENTLDVVSGYSSNAEISSTGTASAGVRKDEILYNSSAQTLTDKTYYATGVTNGDEYTWGAASPTSGVRIGEHVSQIKKEPVFKYYAYAASPSKLGSGASSDLSETSLAAENKALGSAAAATVGAVAVNFEEGPGDAETGPYDKKESEIIGVRAPESSLVTLNFEVPGDETATKDGPCE